DGTVFWDSPWGKGRPGWHIECSAMANAILGPTIDLHCGGIDNLFPHHENEIAQSVCCNGVLFSKHWFHVSHLHVDGRKMSKSAGNFYTLRDLLNEGVDPSALRYLLLQNHYSASMNCTRESIHAAHQTVYRLEEVNSESESISEDVAQPVEEFLKKFWEGLLNDLNTPLGLGFLFEAIREINRLIDTGSISRTLSIKIIGWLSECDTILDLRDRDSIPLAVQVLVEKRNESRKARNWSESDRYREEIESLGFILEDFSDGSRIRRRL
ncbi:DALR domain-containing protein, partial [Candidatus Similichlamydia epinepheli]|uniref:DALR domain-containing protein n=1 Tax=Candidatus Similichlamydia epinepheli TaxID=1903953 RepID=UPI0013004CBA